MTNEHADSALLCEAYYKIAALVEQTTAGFVEAVPNDPTRQLLLQQKLMTGVIANFLYTMPSLSVAEAYDILRFALLAVQQTYEASDPVTVN